MVSKKITRMVVPCIVFWTLAGHYIGYVINQPVLFEYLTLLILGGFASLQVRTPFKYLWIMLLFWNCVDEAFGMFGNEFMQDLMAIIFTIIGVAFTGCILLKHKIKTQINETFKGTTDIFNSSCKTNP